MRTRICLWLWLLPALLAGFSPQTSPPEVIILQIDAPITPAAASYLERGLQRAHTDGAEAVVVVLNTPGGKVTSMNRMVQAIRNSAVPVIVYVGPRGAMAASAGTLITLAGHISAMAPETVIGAASPVGPGGHDLEDTLRRKINEVLKATARSLTERRGPQAIRLAEAAIENAQAVSAYEAWQAGLIDYIAADVDDLLAQADGASVALGVETRTLHTAGASRSSMAMSPLETLLGLLSSPDLVLLLLVVGMQAILVEAASPGGWAAGLLGVTCLALAAYGLGILSINWFGLIFLGSAFVLFLLDIKAPTHGALTAAGVVVFIIGALVLFNSSGTPAFQRVSVPLVVAAGLASGLFFALLVGVGLRTMRQKPRTGRAALLGRYGFVRTPLAPKGLVQVAGEQWSAVAASGERLPIPRDVRIQVVEVRGIHLVVRRLPPAEAARGGTMEGN